MHLRRLLEDGSLRLHEPRSMRRVLGILRAQKLLFTARDPVSRSFWIGGSGEQLPHAAQLQMLLQHFGRNGLKHLHVWHGLSPSNSSRETQPLSLALAVFDEQEHSLAAFLALQKLNIAVGCLCRPTILHEVS